MRTARSTSIRFIPALAGNTPPIAGGFFWGSVYPRSRGEHFASALGVAPSTGLSPLSRGTHRTHVVNQTQLRFIPALAGNTRPLFSPWRVRAVYPRSRGEHKTGTLPNDISDGLSPLSRGTLQSPFGEICQSRFIPALAGNTLILHICF